MSNIKGLFTAKDVKPVLIDGTGGNLFLRPPSLYFAERVIKAQVEAEGVGSMPVVDVVYWAFSDGVVCDADGNAFEDVNSADDIARELGSQVGTVVFVALMKYFGESVQIPKPKRVRKARTG